MGGAHELSNLVTLCEECHRELHQETDTGCRQAAPGPTVVGAAFASLPGHIGAFLARLTDGIATLTLVTLCAALAGVALLGGHAGSILAPLVEGLHLAVEGDPVVLAWLLGALFVEYGLAIQPLVRRLRPSDVPRPPVGAWQGWTLVAGVVLVTGCVVRFASELGGATARPLGTAAYAIGLATVGGFGSLWVLGTAVEETSPTTRWWSLVGLHAAVSVGGLALYITATSDHVRWLGLAILPVSILLMAARTLARIETPERFMTLWERLTKPR